ncbi:MAG: hypothetical protein ACOYW3_16300 [Bacteroidota bacterium]
MTNDQLEDLYVRSLDETLTPADKELLLNAVHERNEASQLFDDHKKVRDVLAAPTRATFGPYFAARLIHKIQNTGTIIDRELFGLFKRFQLAALGIVVVLLILNFVFADQLSMGAILGIEQSNEVTDETSAPFNLSETFDELL